MRVGRRMQLADILHISIGIFTLAPGISSSVRVTSHAALAFLILISNFL